MSRSEFYNGKGLTIPQIEAVEAMPSFDFENWVQRGCSIRALDVLLEEKNARAHKGQVPPSAAAAQVRVKGQTPELGDGKSESSD